MHDAEVYFDARVRRGGGGTDPGAAGVNRSRSDGNARGVDQIVGIWFVTDSAPLAKCQPVNFEIFVNPPSALGKFIKVYLTDKDHNAIGQIGAQRTPGRAAAAFESGGLVAWPPDTLDATCPEPKS